MSIDITDVRAVALDAALQALERMGISRPSRWLRNIGKPYVDLTNGEAKVHVKFWLGGHPAYSYILDIELARDLVLDVHNRITTGWLAQSAQGFEEHGGTTRCSFSYHKGQLVSHFGQFPPLI